MTTLKYKITLSDGLKTFVKDGRRLDDYIIDILQRGYTVNDIKIEVISSDYKDILIK